MNKKKFIFAILVFIAAVPFGAAWGEARREIFEIYLPFERGAEARAILPDGRTWTLGHVTSCRSAPDGQATRPAPGDFPGR